MQTWPAPRDVSTLWDGWQPEAAHGLTLPVGCNADPAARVAELIGAVDAANATPVADTITLSAGCTYTFTASNEMVPPTPPGSTGTGPTPCPPSPAPSTIEGNGATTTWSLRNSNSAGVPDVTFTHGQASDLPLSWR